MTGSVSRLLARASIAGTLLVLVLAGVRGTPVDRAADTASPAVMASGGMTMPSAAAGILAEGAWIRATMDTATPGGAYLTLTNTSAADDALVSVTSPAAATVELHETMAGDSGMMGMRPVGRLDLPAGAVVTLEPGGYHLMLIGLVAPLAEGATVDLVFTFEHAPVQTVTAQVVSATGVPMPSMDMPPMDLPSAAPIAGASPMPSMAGM